MHLTLQFMNTSLFQDPIIKKSDAVTVVGSEARLARLLGVKRQSVNSWGDYLPVLQAYRFVQIHPSLDCRK